MDANMDAMGVDLRSLSWDIEDSVAWYTCFRTSTSTWVDSSRAPQVVLSVEFQIWQPWLMVFSEKFSMGIDILLRKGSMCIRCPVCDWDAAVLNAHRLSWSLLPSALREGQSPNQEWNWRTFLHICCRLPVNKDLPHIIRGLSLTNFWIPAMHKLLINVDSCNLSFFQIMFSLVVWYVVNVCITRWWLQDF